MKKPDKHAAWNSSLWDVIVITCWDVIRSKQPRWCIILLLSSYMVGNFFLISEYMSSFTALMVRKSYISPPINNVEQFWASKMKWLGGRMTEYYIDRLDFIPDFEDRLSLIRIKETGEEVTAIEKVLKNPDDYVYFENKDFIAWSICHHNIDLKGRNIFYSEQTLGDYTTHLYLPKGSVETEAFNRKILRLQDMGLIHFHLRRYANERLSKICLEEKKENEEMIQLHHVQIGFYLIFIGYALALASLLIEIVKSLKKMKRDLRTVEANYNQLLADFIAVHSRLRSYIKNGGVQM